MKSHRIFILTLLFGSYASVAQEAGLDLFQATDSPNQANENDARRTRRTSQANTEPAFTLVGTSRFGSEYYASLLHRNGTSVQMQWEKGVVKPIEGYLEYAIADVKSRTVSIRMPSDDPCIENPEKGVACNGNLAVLSLSNAAPLEARVEVQTESSGIEVSSPDLAADVEDEPALFRNPFSGEMEERPQLTPEEQAARDERRARREEQFRNFEIVRIPDDEIPEGMRRVRTPFGDTLEPLED